MHCLCQKLTLENNICTMPQTSRTLVRRLLQSISLLHHWTRFIIFLSSSALLMFSSSRAAVEMRSSSGENTTPPQVLYTSTPILSLHSSINGMHPIGATSERRWYSPPEIFPKACMVKQILASRYASTTFFSLMFLPNRMFHSG